MLKVFMCKLRRRQVAFYLALLAATLSWSSAGLQAQTSPPAAELQWLNPNDVRLSWLNIADWEPRDGGWQPVRVPKTWRERWPERTAGRAQSAAGMAVRFRTNSAKLVFRLTFIEVPDRQGGPPEALWERSRPSYFDLYRDGKYVRSIPGATRFTEQDVTLIDESSVSPADSEIMVLLPFYYRNAELALRGVGLDRNARVAPPAADNRPRVLFHGDSITHGHGVTSPRETYGWLACEQAACVSLNLGFGGSAWGDRVVAEYIAGRSDFDVLVIAIGTNSFGGADSAGQPETVEQYGKKYETFLNTIRAKHPSKPILCVTPIWNRSDGDGGRKNRNGETPQDYRNAIRRVVEGLTKTDRNLHLLDGLTLVNDPLYLLVTDVVHPNMAGSLRMAEGIAAKLKPLLPRR